MCDDFRVGISKKILQRLHVGTHLLWIKPVQRLTVSNQERNNNPKVSILSSYHLLFFFNISITRGIKAEFQEKDVDIDGYINI